MPNEPKEAFLIKRIEASAAGSNCQMRIGDLDGDGRLDFVLLRPDTGFDDRYFPHSVATATAYTADGEILWQIGKPSYLPSTCKTDLPAQIFDIDRDGYNEFLCVTDGAFCIFDGKTGDLKRRLPLPDKFAYDCFAFADLDGAGYPGNIIIKNKYHQIWAMDQNFNIIWTFKGNIGHYPIICDINKDGRDEIIAGKYLLDADGGVMWEFPGIDFPESIFVADLNKSGEPSIISGGDGVKVFAPDATLKRNLKNEIKTKNLTVGNMRPDLFGSEIAGFFTDEADSEFTDGIFLTDYHGNTLFKEKRTNYIKNSEIDAVYNFDGTGTDHLLVSAREGSPICLYDGYMNPCYTIPSQGTVFWADILADTIAQIIVYDGQFINIYSAVECDLTKPAYAGPRPQTKRLYNYTVFPYHAEETQRNALGYAIGQFAMPDVRSWAEQCATEESEEVISRADFCVVLTEAAGIRAYSAEAFFDVSKNDYYYPAVTALKSSGALSDLVGKFSPESPATADFALDLIQKTTGFTPLTTKSGDDILLRRDAAKLILQIYQNKETD